VRWPKVLAGGGFIRIQKPHAGILDRAIGRLLPHSSSPRPLQIGIFGGDTPTTYRAAPPPSV
jgi:hypothetical protein